MFTALQKNLKRKTVISNYDTPIKMAGVFTSRTITVSTKAFNILEILFYMKMSKVKSSMCLTKYHTMKTNSFLN